MSVWAWLSSGAPVMALAIVLSAVIVTAAIVYVGLRLVLSPPKPWRDVDAALAQLTTAFGGSMSENIAARLPAADVPVAHRSGVATHAGTPFVYEAVPRARGQDMHFAVGLVVASYAPFVIRRETNLDRRATATGISREWQTGDARFDAEFYLEAEAAHVAAELGRSAERRDAIRRLFQAGAARIARDDSSLCVVWEQGGITDTTLVRDNVLAAVADLRRLTDVEPSAPPAPTSQLRARVPARTLRHFAAIGAWMFGTLIVAVGVGQAEFPLHTDPVRLLLTGLVAGLIGAAVVGLTGAFLFERSTGHRRLIAVTVSMIFPAFLLGVFGVARFNAAFDRGPATERTVRALAKVEQPPTASKESPRYIVDVDAWSGAGVQHVEVPHHVWQAVVPGDTLLKVVTKPGRLGIEWLAATPEVRTRPAPVAAGAAPAEPEPTDARGYHDRGRRRLRFGRHALAAEDFKRAIALDPALHGAYHGLDDALVPLHDWDTIILYWTMLLEREPSNAVALDERAGARMYKGDRAAALADWDASCRLGRAAACQTAETARRFGVPTGR